VWRHGYELILETGLKAGTLYPVLARLADRGWLDARWETAGPPGRPPRHLYRLTTTGLEETRALAAAERTSGLGRSLRPQREGT
jgi:DNA-binding PadR family transcriptional regulator